MLFEITVQPIITVLEYLELIPFYSFRLLKCLSSNYNRSGTVLGTERLLGNKTRALPSMSTEAGSVLKNTHLQIRLSKGVVTLHFLKDFLVPQ